MTTMSNALRPASMPRTCPMPPTVPVARRPAVTLPVRIVDLLQAWQDRRSGRRELAALDDALLKDIGRSRADVDPEIRKPFWRR